MSKLRGGNALRHSAEEARSDRFVTDMRAFEMPACPGHMTSYVPNPAPAPALDQLIS